MKKLLLTLLLLLVPASAFAQCNGVFPATTVCGTVAGGIPGPIPSSTFPASTLGMINVSSYANITAAYATCPAGGGTVVIPPNYSEILTTDLTLNKAYCGLLFLGTATITTGINHIIMGTSVDGVFMRSIGAYTSSISGVAPIGVNIVSSVTSGAAISLGASGQRTNYHSLSGITVDIRAASAGTIGVQLTRVVYWNLDHLTVAGGNANNTGVEIDGTAGDFGGFGQIFQPIIRNMQKPVVTTGAANSIQMIGGILDCNNIASSSALIRDGTLTPTAGFVILGTELSTCTTGATLTGTVKGDNYLLYTENNTTDVNLGASTSKNVITFIISPFTKTDAGTNNILSSLGLPNIGVATGASLALGGCTIGPDQFCVTGTATHSNDLAILKNENSTLTLSLFNSDTTNSSSRTLFDFQAGNVHGRIEGVNGDAFYMGSGSAVPYILQYNATNQIIMDGVSVTDQVKHAAPAYNIVGGATKLAWSGTAPTISSGFCSTSPSIASNNGSAAFTINVGTSCSVATGVIGLPTASAGWKCDFSNVTHPDANKPDQTASSTTSVNVTNYVRTTGVAGNWTASDVIAASCTAY